MYTLKMNKTFFSEQKGQTLIEVIVALALIAFFLSGVITVQLFSIKNTDYSNKKSLATSLARQQLERVRVLRDSVGIDALSACEINPCFVNAELTPESDLPTGYYRQSFIIKQAVSDECTLPEITITPVPVVYKVMAEVIWLGNSEVTPAPNVNIYSCLTDWR